MEAKYLLMEKSVNTIWYLLTMEYYSVLGRKFWFMLHSWMNLEIINAKWNNQMKKDKYSMIPLIYISYLD